MHKKNGLVLNTGQGWNISVPESVSAEWGSNVIVPCSFTYPTVDKTKDVKVYWKKNYHKSEVETGDNDINAFVFHTNDSYVLGKYQGKTKLIGNKDEGNCTLEIQDIRESEPSIYVRVIAKNPYSFNNIPVQIILSGENFSNISLY